MRTHLFVPLALFLGACTGTVEPPDEQANIVIEGQVAPTDVGLACAGESADAVAARTAIARVRAYVGLPPLSCDPQAAAAAQAHCNYVDLNRIFSHTEVKGNAGFTGVTVTDRLAAAKFTLDPSGEVMATLVGSAAVMDWRGFMNSVYHRPFFLRAESTVFGYGGTADCATFDFGKPKKAVPSAVPVVWPPDGATNVPRAFRADHETPNPVPGSTEVGSPISWVGNSSLTKLDVKVYGPLGQIPIVILTKDNDPAKLVRAGEVHVIPKAALAPHTQYAVTFRATADDKALLYRTTFTTGD